jgi:hypothetical protein
MCGRQKRATVTGDVSGIERGSINFAVRRSSTWSRRRKSLPLGVSVVGARNLIPVGTDWKARPHRSSRLSPGAANPMIGSVSQCLQPLRSR